MCTCVYVCMCVCVYIMYVCLCVCCLCMYVCLCAACCQLMCRVIETMSSCQISPSETKKLFMRLQSSRAHLVREREDVNTLLWMLQVYYKSQTALSWPALLKQVRLCTTGCMPVVLNKLHMLLQLGKSFQLESNSESAETWRKTNKHYFNEQCCPFSQTVQDIRNCN